MNEMTSLPVMPGKDTQAAILLPGPIDDGR
ncbi:putative protein OS=Sphingobium scionense OX=1404341 GN=GGQ90_004896 PE=4 SV=1 [Sphingobium scionense]|jgi:hypothetical protein|uniref:Uncharacterized protein n=1 Tax=Sphingobium scionense TaxID=1404341 RepID=A0A7W6LVA2_9SPHN|nr:hypothetical protein [Sphingobium scionense]